MSIEQLSQALINFVILAIIAALGYLIRSKLISNDEKHSLHFKRAEMLESKIREEIHNLEIRIKSNDEILAVVNAKYLSRREADMLLEQRHESETELLRQIEKAKEEIIKQIKS